MAFGTGDLLQTLQQGVQGINNLRASIITIFPQLTGTSTTAPSSAAAITFTSSEAAGFFLVTTSSGYTAKVPFYPQ
jgi:hypothetical protein